MLRNVKVGDWIFTIKKGWIRVSITNHCDNYPILAEEITFSISGCHYLSDQNPSAWTYNPFDSTDFPPFEFKKGQIIVVWDEHPENGVLRVFDEVIDDRYVAYVINSLKHAATMATWKNARPLTPTELGEPDA